MKSYKELYPFCIFIIITSCENPSSIGEFKDDQFNITYEKYGGWINPSELKIFNDGLAQAKIISQSTRRLLDSGEMNLNDNEKRNLLGYISLFDKYSPVYYPQHYITDQNYNVIIVRKKSRTDTVSVYNLYDANIPATLRTFINELEKIKYGILRNDSIAYKINS